MEQTPKEKADEIKAAIRELIGCSALNVVTDAHDLDEETEELTEHLALIHVEGIIKQWEYIDTYLADLGGKLNPNLKYWYEVKQEIFLKNSSNQKSLIK